MNFILRRAALLLAFFALGLSPFSAEAQNSKPEQTIRDFYKWYVGELMNNRDPLTDNRKKLQQFTTTRLLREIDGMRKGPDGLNGDLFVDAQDFDKDWGKNINISEPEITGDKATTNVELRGAELGTKKLRVSLVQQDGMWKVDKVAGR